LRVRGGCSARPRVLAQVEHLSRLAHVCPGSGQRAVDPPRDATVEAGALATGIDATRRGPPQGGLSIERVPPRASTRSASPHRPEPPAGSAPPRPSSATITA